MQILKERIIIFGTIIVFLCTLQWITTNAIFFFVAMLLLVCGLGCDNEELIFLYVMLLPSIMIIKKIGNSSAWLGYFGILFTLKLLVFQRKRYVSKKLFVAFSIHAMSILFSIIFSNELGFLNQLIRFLSLIVIICTIKSENYINQDQFIDKLILSYTYGTVLNCTMGIIYYLSRNRNLFDGFFAGINNDRNYFAIQTAVACILFILLLYKNQKIKLTDGIILLGLLSVGVLSGSRTYLILAIWIIVMLIITLKELSVSNILISVIPIVLCASCVILNFKIGESVQGILERFAQKDVASGNGRFDAWKFYIGQVLMSIRTILFGVGSSSKVIELGYVQQAEHNSIVQALYQFGIMGIISFGILIVSIFNYLRAGIKLQIKFVDILGFLGIVFAYSTISSFYSDNFNIAILLFIVLMCKQERQEEKYCEDYSN